MPIVPSSVFPETENSVVSLARYAQLINYPEAAFFGVHKETDPEYGCRTIWTKMQRDAVTRALWEAQIEIEDYVGYPLFPTYFEKEQIKYSPYGFTKKYNIIKIGTKIITVIGSNITLTHTSDPATLIVATTATDVNEVHIYHPGTSYEIMPSAAAISGGNYTASIPRSRLVSTTNQDNPKEGHNYQDTGITGVFEQVVDIKRIYTDTTDMGTLETIGCSCTQGNHSYALTCVSILNKLMGFIKLGYQSNVCSFIQASAVWVELNYLAGLQTVNPRLEDVVIRLAHTKMPDAPCGCEFVKGLWTRDKNIPDFGSPDRAKCPFGLSDGAWTAWRFVQPMKVWRSSMI